MTEPIVSVHLSREGTKVTLEANCIDEEAAILFRKCCDKFLLDLKKLDERKT